MAAPTLTHTITNGTSADASQVMQNFNDLLNGITDGTKDISIGALTAAGAASLNGSVTLGNASTKDVTINGSLASSIPVKTAFSFDIGANATGLRYLFLGSSDGALRSTKLQGATIAAAYTFTLPVDGGTSRYKLQTDGAGTTSWTPDRHGGNSFTNVGIACSVAANALTIALKGSNGSDPSATNPVDGVFRNTSATSGTPLTATVSTAISLVISSGSTLGHKAATDHFIYVDALYQSATSFELAVSSSLFDEGSLQSSVAEGGTGTADSISSLYSTTARANCPVRLIARLKSNQTVAGTYAAAPTEVSLAPFSKRKAYMVANDAIPTNFITSTQTDCAFPTVQIDSHNSYNATTGVYTVPVSGVAKVSVSAKLNVTLGTEWNTGQIFQLKLNYNSADIRITQWMAQATSTGVSPHVTLNALFQVAAGDTFKVIGYQDSGATYGMVTSEGLLFNFLQVEIDPYAF